MRKILSIMALLTVVAVAKAQYSVSTASFKVEPHEDCRGTENKKAARLLESAKDRKNSKEERLEALRAAVDEDPECAEAHYLLGLELLRSALSRGSSFKSAENELKETIRLCPEFHFEPYYYLGAMALGSKDYDGAISYYKKYLELSGASTEELDEKREEEIKLDFEYAQFFQRMYANPVPFEPKRVRNVCTEDDEYLPLISPDNESMLLTRRYGIRSQVKASLMSDNTQYTEKFVKAERTGESTFHQGEPFPTPFNENESFRYGGATMTIDNKRVYLTICKPASMGYVNCDIYSAELKYGTDPRTKMEGYYWTDLENLGEKVNTEDGFESQPSISADGNTLYFTSDRGENAGLEIYFTTKGADGKWQEAQNIGPPINTPYNDKTPFMHSDSRTLYFASDGHLGLGGLDVFYTRQKEDGTWEEPVNLGFPINSEHDEQAFAISTDGQTVYYSAKDREEPRSIEIWSFPLYKEARPDKVVFVRGTLKTDDGSPAERTTVELKTMESKKVMKVDVSEDDGYYAAVIAVKEDEDVMMNIKGEDLAFQSKLIETAKPSQKQARLEDAEVNVSTFQEVNFEVNEVKDGGVYRINDIFYATNSAEISAKSKLVLEEFATYLKEHPAMRIAIHGHTDNVGNVAANLALSTDRAFSVKQYLEQHGVEGHRIEYKGYGSGVPFADNNSEEGRALNRRTEFVILSK